MVNTPLEGAVGGVGIKIGPPAVGVDEGQAVGTLVGTLVVGAAVCAIRKEERANDTRSVSTVHSILAIRA